MSQIGIDTCPSADGRVHLVMVDDDASTRGFYQEWFLVELNDMPWVTLAILPGQVEALAHCRLLPAGSHVFLVSDGNLGVPGQNGPDLLDAFRCLAYERRFTAGMRLLSGTPEEYQKELKLRFLDSEHRLSKVGGEWPKRLRQGLQELRAAQASLVHAKPHSAPLSIAPSAEG